MQSTRAHLVGLLVATVAVMTIAVVVRLSSLHESFWVDELHSAWCVWGSFSDVLPRAGEGNQSPVYFAGLWAWKQLVGESEFALRLSSVIAVAMAAGVLCVGVGRWTGQVAAGAVAGLTLALESNALFFGTELRPFAMVILFASLATVCFIRLATTESRDEDWPSWLCLVISVLLAMACQPTSLGVLVCLPAIVCLIWAWRDRGSMTDVDGKSIALAAVAIASFWALWKVTLDESWHRRQAWASFGTATDPSQIGEAWNWFWLSVAPACLIVGSAVHRWQSGAGANQKTKTRQKLSLTRRNRVSLAIILLAAAITTAYWIASWSGVMPIWHRRYFIAVLPLMAVGVGGSVASVPVFSRGSNWLFAAVLITGLMWQQGTLNHLIRSPRNAMVTRGEDWRGAVDWVNSNAMPNERILLDAGLIEAQSIKMSAATYQERRYLRYPVLGPYQIRHNAEAIGPDLSKITADSNEAKLIITRRPATRIDESVLPNAKIQGFRGVSVIRLPARD
ncbi:MAG: glycosyltransferase family 39 protein [Rubripirellula sp.]